MTGVALSPSETSEPVTIRRSLAPAAAAAAGHVLARGLAAGAGVRFDASYLDHGWPLLDLSWLRADLLGSVLHLHSQPPLHNLLAGMITIAAPGREAGAFHVLHLALGLLGTLALVSVLTRLGVRPALAVAATVLAMASPAAIVWENNLSYMWPVTVAILGTAWALTRYAERPSPGRAAAALTLAGLPALMWSLFALPYLLVLAFALAAVARPHARQIFAAAAIPLVLVGAWHAKNLVLFDNPSASSWIGLNLFRVVEAGVGQEDIQRLVAEGRVNPIALVPTFSPVSAYEDLVRIPAPAGRPELDVELKQDGVSPNFNHRGYLAVSRAYLSAAGDLMRARPSAYAATVATGACVYLKPSTDYWSSVENRQAIIGYARAYEALAYGQVVEPAMEGGCKARFAARGEFPFILPVLVGVAIAWSGWLAKRQDGRREIRLVAAFVAVTLIWVALVGNFAEFGENNRFRFVTEPLMWIPLALLAESLLARAGERRR